MQRAQVLRGVFGVLLALWWAQAGVMGRAQDPPPVGAVLVYDVLRAKPGGPAPDMEKVLEVLDKRLNPGEHSYAEIRKVGAQRIEVGVFGSKQARVDDLRFRLDTPGTLEFRIAANPRDHQALIDRAQREPGPYLRDADGKPLAWWAPVGTGQKVGLDQYPELVSRERREGGQSITEVLLVIDPHNADTIYVIFARADLGYHGEPCITYVLNWKGGKLLEGLTAAHLPDKTTGVVRKLAIVLDGRLYTLVPLRNPLAHKGAITGTFTIPEAVALAAVLSAGPLPATLKFVQQRSPP